MSQLWPHQTCFEQAAGEDPRRPSVAVFRSVTPGAVPSLWVYLIAPRYAKLATPPLDAASDGSKTTWVATHTLTEFSQRLCHM